jgi:HSP20 family protein
MELIKWTKNLKPKFPKVIENFFGRIIGQGEDKDVEVATMPAININDEEKAFEVVVALPGLDKKDVKIEVQDGHLSVSSEKQYEKEEKNKNWMRREFGYASFQRTFRLPQSADPEKVQATMRNGLLTIRLGKKNSYKKFTRRIEVK